MLYVIRDICYMLCMLYVMRDMSHVIYYILCVLCSMSYVLCHMPYVVRYMWYVTCDMLQLVCDMWYVICYMLHVVTHMVQCHRPIRQPTQNTGIEHPPLCTYMHAYMHACIHISYHIICIWYVKCTYMYKHVCVCICARVTLMYVDRIPLPQSADSPQCSMRWSFTSRRSNTCRSARLANRQWAQLPTYSSIYLLTYPYLCVCVFYL